MHAVFGYVAGAFRLYKTLSETKLEIISEMCFWKNCGLRLGNEFKLLWIYIILVSVLSVSCGQPSVVLTLN